MRPPTATSSTRSATRPRPSTRPWASSRRRGPRTLSTGRAARCRWGEGGARGGEKAGGATLATPALHAHPSQEKGNLTLTCGSGSAAFTGVAFASYGAPTGGCTGASPPAINATCNANTSVAVVAAACVGKHSCKIPATTDTFGGADPCFDVVKRLLVVLEGPCGVPIYSVQATLPPNAAGTVRVPTLSKAPSAVTITEGGATVWKAGAFVPGTPGVTGATADPTGANAVVFSVGSGAYAFAALE